MENTFPQEKELLFLAAAGKELCIGKWQDKFFAIDDRCSHAGGSLSTGRCDEKGNVICPFHRIGFRLKDGGPASGKGYFVEHYPLEIREDGVYMGIRKKWWDF